MHKKTLLAHKKALLALLLICCFLLAGAAAALATNDTGEEQDAQALEDRSDWTIDDYRSELQRINQNIDALENEISAQQGVIDQANKDIAAIDAQLISVNEQLSLTQQQLDLTNQAIDRLQEEIEELQRQLEERMALLKERLVNVYVYGDVSLLDVVFRSSSFQDFLTTYDMVETLVGNDHDLALQIEEERQKLEEDKASLEIAKAELEEVKADQEAIQSNLHQLEAEKEAMLSEANMSLEEAEAMYRSELAAAESATATIKELLQNSDANLSYGGYMIWPLPAPWDKSWVTSEYGWRVHPVYGTSRFHSGIDIAADGGTPIYAAADGQIILRQYYGGYGNCIMIDHGSGVVSLYGHQSGFGSYGVGDYVVAGDVIGYVGTTGTSTGNHLHFETRLNGEYVSPWNYL